MEDGLVLHFFQEQVIPETNVLILVVMEDGLVPCLINFDSLLTDSLNPCCNGRWSRTPLHVELVNLRECLNPCCNGRWSRTDRLNSLSLH